ncbi:unnamed protein product [Protopolystoma xenopodis]|uniref:Uncharacterized protein n=1 Tax=Protopolystoma xenopodis TaxID=117903 RepID=A0A448WS88_9PLAT|nr:unnamed protein product [Protopolystoma xenopodis]
MADEKDETNSLNLRQNRDYRNPLNRPDIHENATLVPLRASITQNNRNQHEFAKFIYSQKKKSKAILKHLMDTIKTTDLGFHDTEALVV